MKVKSGGRWWPSDYERVKDEEGGGEDKEEALSHIVNLKHSTFKDHSQQGTKSQLASTIGEICFSAGGLAWELFRGEGRTGGLAEDGLVGATILV